MEKGKAGTGALAKAPEAEPEETGKDKDGAVEERGGARGVVSVVAVVVVVGGVKLPSSARQRS